MEESKKATDKDARWVIGGLVALNMYILGAIDRDVSRISDLLETRGKVLHSESSAFLSTILDFAGVVVLIKDLIYFIFLAIEIAYAAKLTSLMFPRVFTANRWAYAKWCVLLTCTMISTFFLIHLLFRGVGRG